MIPRFLPSSKFAMGCEFWLYLDVFVRFIRSSHNKAHNENRKKKEEKWTKTCYPYCHITKKFILFKHVFFSHVILQTIVMYKTVKDSHYLSQVSRRCQFEHGNCDNHCNPESGVNCFCQVHTFFSQQSPQWK
jgi:hypothetical protein